MAIDFQEEKNSNPNLIKIIILVVVGVLGVIIILFFKNGGFGPSEEKLQAQLFEPVSIDFDLISSEEFRSLESLKGIPVLPGFIEASTSQTKPEIIEVGRENPFSEVSSSEIDLAVIKVIEKLETLEQVEEMRVYLAQSTLYTESEKNNFYKKLDEKRLFLETFIVSPEESAEEEQVIPFEEENYYKEW